MKKESNHNIGTPFTHSLDILNLPKDVVLGVPIVTITGNIELNIENYKTLIEYTEQLIRIKKRDGEIKILGEQLQISYYRSTEMKITGIIKTIEYL